MKRQTTHSDRICRARRWNGGILISVLILLVSACGATLPQQGLEGPKTYPGSVDIKINGFRRTYLLHIPAGYTAQKKFPLVVVVHGAFDTAKGMEKFSGFSQLADREGFVVLYPNGMGILGYLQHWNAGHCCGKAADDNLDDVGFIAAAIDDVCRQLPIDRARIYMVGFSNGGMLAYRFAAEKSGLLAGVAPLAASIGGRPSAEAPEWHIPEPAQPVSVIAFHGLADNDIRFEGGISQHRKGTRSYWSVDRSIDFWVSRNGCAADYQSRTMNDGNVLFKRWSGCRGETEIALYLIHDWGHIWPGRYFTNRLPQNSPLSGFDAAEIIWNFFKDKRR